MAEASRLRFERQVESRSGGQVSSLLSVNQPFLKNVVFESLGNGVELDFCHGQTVFRFASTSEFSSLKNFETLLLEVP